MKWWLPLSLVLFLGVALLSLCTGPTLQHGLAIQLAIPHGSTFGLRLARIAAAAIVGASLSLSGVYLQNLLRNPLADPYVLGLSGGASLGVVLWIFVVSMCSQPAHLPVWAVDLLSLGHTIPSFIGAAIAMAACFWLGTSRRSGFMDPVRLILAGVIISTITGACMLLVNSFLPPYQQNHVYFYLFGYISEITPHWLLIGGCGVLGASWMIGLRYSRQLDIASLSDIEAAALGVSMSRLRLINFVLSSLLTAASVAIAGPIGFVGLICPHITRRLLGPSHQRLLLVAPILGASLLIGADFVARLSGVLLNEPIPVGVMTALIGGPLFLYMMRSRTGWR